MALRKLHRGLVVTAVCFVVLTIMRVPVPRIRTQARGQHPIRQT